MFNIFGRDQGGAAPPAAKASPFRPLPKATAASLRRDAGAEERMSALSTQVAELDQVGWLPGATRGLPRSAYIRVPLDAMPYLAIVGEEIPTTRLNVISSDAVARNSDERSKGNLLYLYATVTDDAQVFAMRRCACAAALLGSGDPFESSRHALFATAGAGDHLAAGTEPEAAYGLVRPAAPARGAPAPADAFGELTMALLRDAEVQTTAVHAAMFSIVYFEDDEYGAEMDAFPPFSAIFPSQTPNHGYGLEFVHVGVVDADVLTSQGATVNRGWVTALGSVPMEAMQVRKMLVVNAGGRRFAVVAHTVSNTVVQEAVALGRLNQQAMLGFGEWRAALGHAGAPMAILMGSRFVGFGPASMPEVMVVNGTSVEVGVSMIGGARPQVAPPLSDRARGLGQVSRGSNCGSQLGVGQGSTELKYCSCTRCEYNDDTNDTHDGSRGAGTQGGFGSTGSAHASSAGHSGHRSSWGHPTACRHGPDQPQPQAYPRQPQGLGYEAGDEGYSH